MKSQSWQCDIELLKLSLSEQLEECREEQLLEHLAGCTACQSKLERLVADENEWSRFSAALQSSSDHNSPSLGDDRSLANEDWETAADFAVHFLQPARKENAIGRLGDIDVLEVIGHGGMGVVLKGVEDELNRLVAVKVLVPHLASSGAARQRFAREAQAAAMIVHPNVMSIHAVHSTGPLPYLVMPFASNESLQQRIDKVGQVSTIDILRFGLQIAQGLAAAHAQGLVHRDIKPANILLETGNDRVLITDFGLARAADDASLTRSGVIAGTPQFMSPEQARGESVDCRSDLFSLGSVLYVMATGRPPFRSETSYGILRRITDDPARPISEINADIPGWLCDIVHVLHAKRPEDRYDSANQLADLLERCLAHLQQPSHVELPRELKPQDQRIGAQVGLIEKLGAHPIRRISAVLLVSLLAICSAVVTGVFTPAEDVRVNPVQDTQTDPTNDGAVEIKHSLSDSASTSWRDGIEGELDDLNSAVTILEIQLNGPDANEPAHD